MTLLCDAKVKGENGMDNRGSVTVEMCFIAPILVCVMFFSINMFVTAHNESSALRETYVMLCNKGEYGIADDGGGDIIRAEMAMTDRADDAMLFIDCVGANMSVEAADNAIAASAEKPGRISIEMTYDERLPGAGLLVDNTAVRHSVNADREIRDVGNNLRRWQAYGELLSK